MSPPTPAETTEAHGCRIVCRRVGESDGPDGTQLFVSCTPRAPGETGVQARAAYRAAAEVLHAHGAAPSDVVSERLHLADAPRDVVAMREARADVLGEAQTDASGSVVLEVEQPPVALGARLALSLHAAFGVSEVASVERVRTTTDCECAECARVSGALERSPQGARFRTGAIHGRGDDAFSETVAMFEAAERLLVEAGLSFRDVRRTWIHLRDIDRDYDAFNRGRRRFFADRDIAPAPASTGIGGGPVGGRHALSLALYATRRGAASDGGGDGTTHAVMTTPTLNEAPEYGADFVRGLRVVEGRGVALHVSGTASIDEAGQTVHVGDLDAQVDRMLLNVSKLLEGQGADFGDVVSAVTYVKRADDAARLEAGLARAGYVGFPNVVVRADVCRPELLCETEALAFLPAERVPTR